MSRDPLPADEDQSRPGSDVAQSFGVDAARYDRTRPEYPNALVDRIMAASPGRRTLDVGIGTGTSARPFRDRGCSVLGVEPDPRMAEFARASGFHVEVARFEQWDAAGRQFDLVIAGQSWHWIDPVVGARIAAGALVEGGRLAVFWNAAEFPPAFIDVYRNVVPGSVYANYGGRAGYSTLHDQAADGITAADAFTEPQRWTVDWSRAYSRAQWLDQVPTFGGHNQFPAGVLGGLLAGFGAAIDDMGGQVSVAYTAGAVTAVRR